MREKHNKKQPVLIFALVLSMNMFFLFFNGSQYFNLGKYYVLPVITIGVGILFILRQNKIPFYIEHKSILIVLIYIFFITYILKLGAQFDMLVATMLFYLFLLIVSSVKMNERSVRFIINSYIFSGFIFAIILFVQMKQPYAQLGVFRYGVFFSDTGFYDVNFTAAYMLLPALICFNKAIEGRKGYVARVNLGISIIIFMAIALTGSRGAILPFLAIVIYKIINLRKFKISYVIFIIIAILLVLFVLPEDIFVRLFTKSYIGTNTRRFMDWRYGLKVFSMQPWFGNGLYSTILIIEKKLGVVYTAHNSIITIFIQYGMLGSIFNLLIIFYPIYKIRRMKDSKMVLLIYLAFVFTITMIEANVTAVMLIPLSVIYILINYARQNENKNIDKFII